ncbi:hypothetical protein R3P38DRAFT_2808832 [Favolaschia claudopus]|uniref:Uncharacterized protein n=1 Tax=Favolaschia claudopus TaxID=2862362 RepID=A0AAV9ZET4_9AGAR
MMLQFYSFLHLSLLAGAVPLTGSTIGTNVSLEVAAYNNSIVVEIAFPQAMPPSSNATSISTDLGSRAGEAESTVIGEHSGVTSIATVKSSASPSTSTVFVSASALQTSINLPSPSLSNAGTTSRSVQTGHPFSQASTAASTAQAPSIPLSGSSRTSSDTVASRSSSKAEGASQNQLSSPLRVAMIRFQGCRPVQRRVSLSGLEVLVFIANTNTNSKQASHQHLEWTSANMRALYLCQR